MKVSISGSKPTSVSVSTSTNTLNVSAVVETPVITSLASKTTKQQVSVTPSGPKGEQGDKGEQGEQGPAGKDGGLRYTHNQMIPSDTWVIDHFMGVMPHVVVVDSSGDTVFGDVKYETLNRLSITFGGAFAGMAYLN